MCARFFVWFGLCMPAALCFAFIISVVKPNNSVQFLLLQIQGGCYTVSPRNLCLPFILHRSPPLLINPLFLSRGLVTAVKPCIEALTYAVLPPPSPAPHPSLPRFSPSTLCWSVTPPPLLSSTGPLCHCNVAICSWCCGADNSLFYLPLSSTKGPGHWSNASRLMAAQQAAFNACDTA